METKIFKITIGAGGKSNVRGNVIEINCKETEKSYKWAHNLVKKTSIMKPDSLFRNDSPSSLTFYTYCLDGYVDEAKEMLKDHCIKLLEKFEQEVSNLRKSLQKEF